MLFDNTIFTEVFFSTNITHFFDLSVSSNLSSSNRKISWIESSINRRLFFGIFNRVVLDTLVTISNDILISRDVLTKNWNSDMRTLQRNNFGTDALDRYKRLRWCIRTVKKVRSEFLHAI